MKKIVICGDSWTTPDRRCPGRHFGEILETSYGYSVVNLSRAGLSTVGICLQLQAAAKMYPDTIVLGTTSPDRLAVAVSKFDPAAGLNNVIYNDKISATCGSPHVGGANAPVISDTFSTLLNTDVVYQKYPGLSENMLTAIKYYYTYLHNEHLQKEIDHWMIGFWINQLTQQGIKIVYFWSAVDQLEENIKKLKSDRTSVFEQMWSSKWVFHTDFETQSELAQIINETLITTLEN